MLQGKRTRRIIAATFLTVMLTNTLAPTVTYALTSGPTSPEATSFEPIDTTDMVNMLTGDFTYNLPLLEVPGPEGGFPISLSYHAGIQPNEDASWVGLGWSLNTGAINRFVSGYPDDWENVKETRRDYWSGGKSIAVGISYQSSGVSFGLNFSNDTYRGFDVGVSAGAGPLDLDMSTASGGTVTATVPFPGIPRNSGVSSSFGITTNFESISISNTTRFSYSGIGITTNSNGGIQYSAGYKGVSGNISISNSKEGKISTSGFTVGGGFPIGGGYVGLSFSKKRYWSDETSDEPVNGALYFNGKPKDNFSSESGAPLAYQNGFDTYFLNDNTENIVDHPDPASLQGGAYVDFDMYDIAAQGLGGTFRPYIFQGNVVSEFRPGDGINKDKIRWHLPGNGSLITHTNPQFRFVGEFSNKFTQNVESDYSDMNNILYGTAPFDGDPKYGDNQFKAYDANSSKLEGSKHIDYFTNLQILEGDAQQKGFIAPVNAKGFQRTVSNSYYSYTSVNDDGASKGITVIDNSLGQQIGAFSITNENGVTYHFGLPAYSKAEQVYTERILKYNSGTVWNNLTKGKSYAYTWYLTSITGADFVDRNHNGIADKEDYGYFVNFEYGKWTDSYNWRNPSQGFHRDVDNEFQTYSKGKKEIYYLNAVSTRTHTAIFEKDYRMDGRGTADDAFVVRDNHSNEYPGGFNSSSKGSLSLSHIYLFNNDYYTPLFTESSGNLLTTNPNEYQNNVIDKFDIYPVKNSIEDDALRVIDFNYDYTLAEHTPSNLDGTGKLTLKSVFMRGINGLNLLPPVRFYYELDPSQQVRGNITCTNNCDGNNLVFEFTSSASFAVGDILNVNGREDILINNGQNYQCVILSYNQATNTYKAKEIPDESTPRPSPRDYNGTAVTTKNPWYNKDAYDLWGMYKPDYDQAAIDKNENLGRATDKVSAKSTDAWSLRKIRTMMGDDIIVNYEPDSYSTSAANGMASLLMDKDNIQTATLADGSTNLTFKLNLPAGNSVSDFFQKDDILETQILQYASNGPNPTEGIVTAVVIKKDELTIAQGDNILVSLPFNLSTYRPLTVTAIDDVNGIVTANTTVPFQNEMKRLHPEYPYFSYKGGNVLNNNNRMTYGGGVRVKSLGIGHLIDNSVSFTTYDYNTPASQASSGVTPYEPGVFDNCDILVASEEANFKRTLYSRGNDLLNLARELPAPGVQYQYITVGHTIKKAGEVERVIEGKTTYEYEVFNNNMVWRQIIPGGKGRDIRLNNRPTQTNVVSIKKSLSRIGNIKRITNYDDRGKALSLVEYQYLHNGLETAPAEAFYTQYKQLLEKYQHQGLIQERYLDLKYTGSGHDPFYTERATMSGREEYPVVRMGETHIDYISGTITSTNNLAFDFFSGAVTKSETEDAYGNVFVSEAVPAYRKYDGMGLKINNAANKNMLTSIAANYVYKYVNANDPGPVGLVSAQVQTWSNQVPVLDNNDNIVTQNNAGGEGNVWREQATYVWQPAGSNSDGITLMKDFTAFNWSSPAAASANWKKNLEATLYDVNSHSLEVKDVNGNYAATRMDLKKQRIEVSGNATNYYELAFSGAEGVGNMQPGPNDVQYADGGVGGVPHTGNAGLYLDGGGKRGFVYTVSTNKLVAGRNYGAKVWVKSPSANADVKLYYKIDGVEKGIAAYTASSQNAGLWRLLHLIIKGSDIIPGATLEVGCRNDNTGQGNDLTLSVPTTGTYEAGNSITMITGFEGVPEFVAQIVPTPGQAVALDDFRFQPLNASATAYVYDDYTGQLTYVLDNNNLFHQFQYDDAGRLFRTFTEKMGAGAIKTSEYAYNSACQEWVFTNKPINDMPFMRHDCSGTPTSVSVSVPKGMFGSCISQEIADMQAIDYAQREGNRLSVCGPRVYVYLEAKSAQTTTSCTVTIRTTFTLHFYSDPKGINPMNVTNLAVPLQWYNQTKGDPPIIIDATGIHNGTKTVLATDIPTFSSSNCGGPVNLTVTSGYQFPSSPDRMFTLINSAVTL